MPAGTKLGALKPMSSVTPLHAVHALGGVVPLTVVTLQRVMKPSAVRSTGGGDGPASNAEELQVSTRSVTLTGAVRDGAEERQREDSRCCICLCRAQHSTGLSAMQSTIQEQLMAEEAAWAARQRSEQDTGA